MSHIKKIIAYVAVLFCAFYIVRPAQVYSSGVSLVQKKLQVQFSSSNAVSFNSSVSTGNTIIVAVTQYNKTLSSVSDNQGNTYTAVNTALHANPVEDYVELYYAPNVTGGTVTVTVTFAGQTSNNVAVYEYTGLDQTSPLDKKAANTGNSSSPNGGTLTTTIDGELYFAVGVDNNGNNTTINPGSGYTLENNQNDSTQNERFYTEDKILNHGSYSTNFSIATGSKWAVIGASFKPISGPTPTPSSTPTPSNTPTPSATPTITPTPTGNPNRPDHIVVLFEEDHQLQQVLATDYFTTIASEGALMVNAKGISHPSSPNYYAFFSGSQQGVTNNNCPPDGSPFGADNLAHQLESNGMSFAGYYEVPSVQCVSTFAWEWFNNVLASDDRLFSLFPSDFTTLPTVSFILPHLSHNMHDGTVQQASDWAKTNLDAYKVWASTHNSMLIITTDEDDVNGTNPIYTVFYGPMIKRGLYNEPINHYNVLSTIESLYGLPKLNSASAITDIFNN